MAEDRGLGTDQGGMDWQSLITMLSRAGAGGQGGWPQLLQALRQIVPQLAQGAPGAQQNIPGQATPTQAAPASGAPGSAGGTSGEQAGSSASGAAGGQQGAPAQRASTPGQALKWQLPTYQQAVGAQQNLPGQPTPTSAPTDYNQAAGSTGGTLPTYQQAAGQGQLPDYAAYQGAPLTRPGVPTYAQAVQTTGQPGSAGGGFPTYQDWAGTLPTLAWQPPQQGQAPLYNPTPDYNPQPDYNTSQPWAYTGA